MDEVAKKKKMPVGLTAEQKELGGLSAKDLGSMGGETARTMQPSVMEVVLDGVLGPKKGKNNATAVIPGMGTVDFESKTPNPSAEEMEIRRKYKEKINKMPRK